MQHSGAKREMQNVWFKAKTHVYMLIILRWTVQKFKEPVEWIKVAQNRILYHKAFSLATSNTKCLCRFLQLWHRYSFELNPAFEDYEGVRNNTIYNTNLCF
jgi:hypothetical protein